MFKSHGWVNAKHLEQKAAGEKRFFALSYNLNTDPPCAIYYGLFRKYYTKKSAEEMNNNLDY